MGIGGVFAVGSAALLANFPGHPKTLLALSGLAFSLGVLLAAGSVAYIGARTYRRGGSRLAALALLSYVVIIIVGPSSLLLLSPDFLGYQFSVDVMVDASDEEVLDMFARLNTYTVKLNKQELRNAKYHGEFKSAIYSFASIHLPFFRKHGVLSEQMIMRMADAELISEMIVAMLDGLQDKKKSLNTFYERYNKEFKQESSCRVQLKQTLSEIDRVFGAVLQDTRFRTRTLFYSLFCCLFDITYGLPKEKGPYGRIPQRNIEHMQGALRRLDEQIVAPIPRPEYAEFVKACKQQTDNIIPRQQRHKTILDEFRPFIESSG